MEKPDLTFLDADLRPHVAALDAAVALLIESEGYIDVDRLSPPADWRNHALAGCVLALRAAGWTVEPPA